jgi:hypothetical protein
MVRKWFGISVLVLVAVALLNLASCARSQHLQSINVTPGNGTFAAPDPTAYLLYKAYGTYIHPPQTIDITTQVTWNSDNPLVVTVDAGKVSPTTACGVGQIFATMNQDSNDVQSNQVTITVEGPASLGCPQNSQTFNLSVDVTAGAADGTIASSPAGINCGTTCSAPFAAGASVSLTATPLNGKAFLGWASGCTSVSGQTCNVTLNSDVTVSGSFN